MSELRAPFPWFGGKSRAAPLVWEAFGNVPNYVEPFLGSAAVLLARPSVPRVETVNDKDCYLANFWRAVHADSSAVAHHADWPVNEADLHARHRWLVAQVDFRRRMREDPDYFDAKVAGWWVWGISQWIGSGWCAQAAWEEQETAGATLAGSANWEGRAGAGRNPRGVHGRRVRGVGEPRPAVASGGGAMTGVHANRLRDLGGSAAWQKRPAVGMGVHANRLRDLGGSAAWQKRPAVGDGLRGVNTASSSTWQQLPGISGSRGAAGRGVVATGKQGTVEEWMAALSARLRYVRVCCGDWERILTPSVTESIGLTGVFLDPPYSADAGRDPSLYSEEDPHVAHHVRAWALANGDNPKLRIALCGYEGEHSMPKGWRCVAWKAAGGYAASAGNTSNAKRERIWFSRHCLPPARPTLFDFNVLEARP